MTKIIITGNIDQLGNTLVTDKEALRTLRLIQSTDTFIFNGLNLGYTESYFTIAASKDSYNELHIMAEELSQ